LVDAGAERQRIVNELALHDRTKSRLTTRNMIGLNVAERKDRRSKLQIRRSANGTDAYDAVTIILHWLITILVLLMFVLAIWPSVLKGATVLHKWLGILLLVLVPLRIVWRLTLGRSSDATANEPWFIRLGAKGAHIALYALLLITPILGWLYVDSRADTLDTWGFDLPMLVYYDRALQYQLYFWKQVAAYSLLVLIVLHVIAAVGYHYVIRQDGVLNSMLPRRFRRTIPVRG
jgi:cytochrome b561